MKLKVILEPSDEGGFTVYVPSLPGCISEGDTLEEALENIREAIDLYLEEEPMVLPEKAQVLELIV
jgi:predicted RNase H-like HicB family nuclease